MDAKATIAALAALAQESRLAVFRLLVQTGPAGMAASKIAQHIAVTPSALSFHMKELAYAGLVSARHEGRFVIYSANFETMNDLIGYLAENCCGGNLCASASVLSH